MKLFAATINVLINAETQGDACDALGHLMREDGVTKPQGEKLIVHDWSYVREQAGEEWPMAVELSDEWCALNERERAEAKLDSVNDVVERAIGRAAPDGDLLALARLVNAFLEDGRPDDQRTYAELELMRASARAIIKVTAPSNRKPDDRRFFFAVRYWNDNDLMHSEIVDFGECPDLGTVAREAREMAGEQFRYETIDKWSVTIDGPMRVSNAPLQVTWSHFGRDSWRGVCGEKSARLTKCEAPAVVSKVQYAIDLYVPGEKVRHLGSAGGGDGEAALAHAKSTAEAYLRGQRS